MPFYRIVIWTTRKKNPFAGIRFVENQLVDEVYEIFKTKAFQVFSGDLLDIEVQQLPRHCLAVIRFLSAKKMSETNNGRFGSMNSKR